MSNRYWTVWRWIILNRYGYLRPGGGSIPVTRDGKGDLQGVPAVIDKDLTSAMLAAEIGAECFVMLTGVDAERYPAEGQFPPGSMGPKITAALRYLRCGAGHVIITSLDKAYDALEGRAGTGIVAP